MDNGDEPTWYCQSCRQGFAFGEVGFSLFDFQSPAYCPYCPEPTELDLWDWCELEDETTECEDWSWEVAEWWS